MRLKAEALNDTLPARYHLSPIGSPYYYRKPPRRLIASTLQYRQFHASYMHYNNVRVPFAVKRAPYYGFSH